MFVQWRPCAHMKLPTMCLASSSTTTAEQLRQQLDNLHKEADTTRAKANNARLRLMRLSEAAEKLRRQASVTVQTGKENEARDLLFQKKKVMQAMEKLKNRIELFDELSAKLNMAISMKEGLLIGNMGLADEVIDEPPGPIRIAYPQKETPNNSDDNQHLFQDQVKAEESQDLRDSDNQVDTHTGEDGNIEDISFSRQMWDDVDNFHDRRGNTAYEDFMQKLDQDLYKIEEELESFVRFSSLLLRSKENPEYSKAQHVMEVLEGVRQTRDRISTAMQTITPK